MRILILVIKEICHRRGNFVLALLAVTLAVALLVSFVTAAKSSDRETARIMLSMGFNVRIVPKDADIDNFLLTGLSNQTMPQENVDKLSSRRSFSYNHLLATLHSKILWHGREVILTGLANEVPAQGRKRPPMVYQIEPGNIYVGYRIAKELGLKNGDSVQIKGKELSVAKCLVEQGGIDDIKIQCHLQDAQAILDLPGRVSEISAVDCLCFADTKDSLSVVREEIASILPETQIFHTKAIAQARSSQRQMVRALFSTIMPFVLIACGVWIGVLAMMNVRDRSQEVGIMRALGYKSASITSLFLGKAVIIGLVGALCGFILGTLLASLFGPDVFKITATSTIKTNYNLLLWSLFAAPLFAAVCSFIPAMIAVTVDPAVTLRQE